MENLNNNLPIYIKIVSELKDLIISGDIKNDEQLPSTTSISRKYEININTVNKSINMLVDEGLVYKKRGIGMFVKKGAQEKLIKERRKTFKEYYVEAVLLEARRLNYTAKELQQLIKETNTELGGQK